MVFSIPYLNAQSCPTCPSNKILISYYHIRELGNPCLARTVRTLCVSNGQIKRYLSLGWHLGYPCPCTSGIAQSNNKMTKRRPGKIADDTVNLSKK